MAHLKGAVSYEKFVFAILIFKKFKKFFDLNTKNEALEPFLAKYVQRVSVIVKNLLFLETTDATHNAFHVTTAGNHSRK